MQKAFLRNLVRADVPLIPPPREAGHCIVRVAAVVPPLQVRAAHSAVWPAQHWTRAMRAVKMPTQSQPQGQLAGQSTVKEHEDRVISTTIKNKIHLRTMPAHFLPPTSSGSLVVCSDIAGALEAAAHGFPRHKF